MENEDKIYQVTNRSDGRVVYSIPEKGIRREFAQGESKKISFKPYIFINRTFIVRFNR